MCPIATGVEATGKGRSASVSGGAPPDATTWMPGTAVSAWTGSASIGGSGAAYITGSGAT